MQQWWQEARRDRLRSLAANALMVAVFVIGTYPFTGWRGAVAAIGVVASALLAVMQGIEWRRHGRWKPSTHDEPVDLDAETVAEVRSLVASGRRTAAVRLIRQRTGAGLLSATRTADALTPAIRR